MCGKVLRLWVVWSLNSNVTVSRNTILLFCSVSRLIFHTGNSVEYENEMRFLATEICVFCVVDGPGVAEAPGIGLPDN